MAVAMAVAAAAASAAAASASALAMASSSAIASSSSSSSSAAMYGLQYCDEYAGSVKPYSSRRRLAGPRHSALHATSSVRTTV